MKNLITLLIVLFYTQIYADTNNYSLLGRWANGQTLCIETESNIAFIGNGSYLTLVDFSTPETPTKISNILLPGMALGAAVNGNFVYVSVMQKGLIIFDISDVNNPVETSTFEMLSGNTKLFFSNNTIYVMDSGGVSIIDVSNPSSPTRVGSIGNSDIQDVYVEGDYAYIPAKESGVYIYDISNPASPQFVKAMGNGNYAVSVIVNNNNAYVGAAGKLYIFNVEDKTNHTELSSIDCIADYIAIDRDTIFATGSWRNLTIVDVSNTASPKITGSLPINFFGQPTGIAVSGNNVLVADGPTGLRIIDATNIANLAEIGKYTTAGPYYIDIVVKNDYAFLSDFSNGLFILDMKDKTDIKRVAIFKPTDEKFFYCLAVEGNYAYMGSPTGLYIIDVSDPENPAIKNKLVTTRISDIKVVGNYAYVTYWQSRSFGIIDISDPENPVEKGTLAGPARAIDVKDSFACVVDANETGFYTINISDPNAPVIESFTENKNIYFARDIFIKGNHVYTSGHGLNITDISDPKNPEVVGWLSGSYWFSIAVIGNDCYIGNEEGLTTINITDPQNPVVAGKYETTKSYQAELFASETKIYLTQAYNGLYVINNDNPTAVKNNVSVVGIELFQNYPNPYNNETTIDYQLPKPGYVLLKIFDTLGQEIATLENGNRETGKHSVIWNNTKYRGQELFYRLKVDDEITITKKMIGK